MSRTRNRDAGERGLRLNRLKLGRRLTYCFVLIILVMSAGSILVVWQVHFVRVQLDRLELVDRELIAVSNFQASLTSFQIRLDELVQNRDLTRLNVESESLRKGLFDDVARTEAALKDMPPGMVRDSTTPSTLDVIQSSLPGYLESLQGLAAAGDWVALRDRLTNQLQPLEFLSAELVRKVNGEVADERVEATASIQAAVERMLLIVPLTGGLSLFIAAVLGIAITRSVTNPLGHLMEGTKALARAELEHQIPVIGEDELAQLARAFNDTTTKLREQFALRLEERFDERTRLARELHDTLLQTIQACNIIAETALDRPDDFHNLQVTMGKLSLWTGQGVLEVRAALDSLRTSSVLRSLMDEIELGMDEIIKRSKAVVHFKTVGVEKKLNPVFHEEVYRIACEAIRNACVHSQGRFIRVEIQYEEVFVLRVCDDGIGIDPEIVSNGRIGHFGLGGMKERAARIGGLLTMDSSSANGTVVTLCIPGLDE